jgi:hypothetical protein
LNVVRRHDPSEEPQVRLECAGEALLIERVDDAEVDRQRPGTRPYAEVNGQGCGTAVNHRRRCGGTQDIGQCRSGDVLLDRGQGTEPAGGGDGTREDGGQRRLVELDDEFGIGETFPHVSDMQRHPVSERGCDVPRCAGIGKRLVAVPQFDRSGQCPRPGDLNLERPAVSLRSLLDGVEILGQPTARPVDIATRPVGEPPPARDGLGRQVDE